MSTQTMFSFILDCLVPNLFLYLDLSAGGTQTNTTARSNPAGDARAAPQGRLGGRGLPDLLSGMPDANTVNQLMQNPVISQMMQSVLSNPQYMNQV